MTLEQVSEVWTPLSVASAAIAGVLFGFLAIGLVTTKARFSSGDAGPLEVGFLTFALVASAGLVFYALQAVTTYLGGDPQWTRVVSRYGLWLLYSAALGVGTLLRSQLALRRRRSRAHDRAVDELGPDR